MIVRDSEGIEREKPAHLITLRLPNGVEFIGVEAGERPVDDIDILIGMPVIGQGDFFVFGGDLKEAVFCYPPIVAAGRDVIYGVIMPG